MAMRRVLMLVVVSLITITTSAQWLDVPAFHGRPPKKGTTLAPILSGLDLTAPSFKYPFQAHCYRLAAKISSLLYQQPCYCHCDRSVGHTSLRSCFESLHGANCAACMKEVFYAYKLHKQGKTPTEIRKGIILGEWQQIDLQRATEIN